MSEEEEYTELESGTIKEDNIYNFPVASTSVTETKNMKINNCIIKVLIVATVVNFLLILISFGATFAYFETRAVETFQFSSQGSGDKIGPPGPQGEPGVTGT